MWSSSLSAVSLELRATQGDPAGERNVGVSRRRLRVPGLVWAQVRWLALVTLATILLVEIPYLLAYARSDRGVFFTGMLWSPHDFSQYAAAMREGAATAPWLIHDQR